MSRLILTIDDVSPAWLTTVLQHDGSHDHTVLQVQITRIHDEQLHSISYALEANWSPHAPTTLPTRFFLKLPRQPDPDGLVSTGAREIATYQFFAAHQTRLPTIPYYDAVYDAHHRRYHLLLADLSHSHDQPRWHLSIDESYVQRTVDCLAQVHAYWWDQPAGCRAIATLRSPDDVAREVQRVREALPYFLAQVAAPLTQQEQQVYARLVAAAPRLWARWCDPSHPTLVHGDAHFWNFLYSHTEQTQPTYILDWQQQHVDWGVSDLAYLLVLRYPHRTFANEYAFVQRYHQALLRHGVANYAWERCWQDYRRAVVEQLLVPLQWYHDGLPDALWQLFVPRSLAAYRDLNGEEFLDE
jgi:hypothetical protein